MLSHFWNLPLAKNMHCLLFLVMQEMAENASTVFNVHVPEFVDAIWVALRDPALPVRERAVEALRACLRVIEKRETRWRVQWLVLNLLTFKAIVNPKLLGGSNAILSLHCLWQHLMYLD